MSTLRQRLGRLRLQMRGEKRVVGWSITPEDAVAFFQKQGKTMLTFYGYSIDYDDKDAMLKIVRDVLSHYLPEKTLVTIGATAGGIGAAYPLIRALKFVTAGIVSTEALANPEYISEAVDHICFIEDNRWGGKLPGSRELSPTSKAMVACSDILVAIGGGDIVRDELLAGRAQGKPIQYFPAEMNHEAVIRRAKKLGLPPPKSFMGSVHELFGGK